MSDRPHVLLTNDDGISAEGLAVLCVAMQEVGEVTVVAPERPRSASSHAITLHKPLRADRVHWPWGGDGYASNGTPSDCVVLGLYALMPRCDLVISGINLGANLGEDLTYSGTVSAAMEGTLCGKPSLAASLAVDERPDYALAARFMARLARQVLQRGLPPDVLLNVNVPNVPEEALVGVAITHQGKRRYSGRVERRVDPRGRPYYWLGGETILERDGDDSDGAAIQAGKISVTPLHLNLTSYPFMSLLQTWNLS